MSGSWLLIWWRSCWLCSALLMTKVSSTNLSQRLGVWEKTEGFDLKLFHEQVYNERTNGGAHSSTLNLFIILTLEKEVCLFMAELQKGDYVLDWHVGPLLQCRFLCSFLLYYVNWRVHWHGGEQGFDIIWCHHLPWFQPFVLDLLDKMLCVFEVVGELSN